jgi:hypothetical protein
MRTILTGLGLVLSLTLFTSTGLAKLRVVKTAGGPAFRLGGKSVPFSAVQRGRQQRLGPYVLKQNVHTGKIDATRRWTFGGTKASHTRSYNASGAFHGWSRSTGSLEAGHKVRLIGRNKEKGRTDWRMEMKDKPLQILVEGTNSKGPLKYSRVLSGPHGAFAKNVYRDGRVEHKFTAPRTALALPAPKAKLALPAPEKRLALPAPEPKLLLTSPAARPLLTGPKPRLGLPAPEARKLLPAPEARKALPAPAALKLLPAPAGK